MLKKYVYISLIILLGWGGGSSLLRSEESLFSKKVVESELVQSLFSFQENNRAAIVEEWIKLTEIPAPSGHEEKRARYMKNQFRSAGLDEVYSDCAGNVVGIWKGKEQGKTVIFSAHMDTVFQGVWDISVKREGNVLKAPGIGDDTASLINMLWTIRALKQADFQPRQTYYFLATVGEEVGFLGMQRFLDQAEEKFDFLVALDGDLGNLHYGALGFGGGSVVFRGPGAHTMQSRNVPNPNVAVAKAVDRLYQIELPSAPLERWTILNVGMIQGGKVRNAVSQESSFTIDLRSASQRELERVQKDIKRICREVAEDTGVGFKIELNEEAEAHQLPGAGESSLVKTVVDIMEYLKVKGIKVDPLGSTEANVGIEKGIFSVNLGRTYGRFKHSLQEEAEIDGLFLAIKQIMLLVCCLEELP